MEYIASSIGLLVVGLTIFSIFLFVFFLPFLSPPFSLFCRAPPCQAGLVGLQAHILGLFSLASSSPLDTDCDCIGFSLVPKQNFL